MTAHSTLGPAPLANNRPAIAAIIAADPRFELIAGTLFFTDGGRRLTLEIGAWDVTDAPHYDRDGYADRAARFDAENPPTGRVPIPSPEERIEPKALIDSGYWEDDAIEREGTPRPPRRSLADRILGRR